MKRKFIYVLLVASLAMNQGLGVKAVEKDIANETVVTTSEENDLVHKEEVKEEKEEVKNAEEIIPDINLKAEINGILGQDPEANITKEQLATLGDLKLFNSNIKSIEGLQYCKNLKSILIQGTGVDNIDVLVEIPKLQEVELIENKITKVPKFKESNNISTFYLTSSNASDISNIKYLKNLKYLVLLNNNIDDITSLKDLSNLEFLILQDNSIEDISSLSNLNKLETLNIINNKITDFTPIENMASIKYLYTEGNPGRDEGKDTVWIEDSNLENELKKQLRVQGDRKLTRNEMASIKEINISNDNIKSLRGLEYCINLQKIRISSKGIENIGIITEIPALEVVDFSDCSITEVPRFREENKVVSLLLNRNNLSDISNIKYLKNLEYLSMVGCGISDVSVIEECEKIQELHLSENKISDITPLKNLKNLKELNLGDNNITDVSSLGDLNELKTLNLRNNNIKDFSPLKNMTNLKHLYTEENPGSANEDKKSDKSTLANVGIISGNSAKTGDVNSLAAILGVGVLSLGAVLGFRKKK